MPSTPRSSVFALTERVSVRASRAQRTVIERAAEAVDKSMTDFVLEAASARAGEVLADRRWFALDDEAYARIIELLDAPAADLPRLRETLSKPSVFDVADSAG